jgi:NitT/TauT family transport system substrate-binding protein
MAVMAGGDAAAAAARTQMAQLSGTDLAGYESQLKTTKLFYTPQEALAFATAPALLASNDLVRKFSFDHGLLGEGAPDADVIGIEFPGGKVLGDPKNIKLRFDASFVQMAAEGKL